MSHTGYFYFFLQLATQHFVAVAGCKTGVLHVKSFLQLVSQQKVARKISSCNMAFTKGKKLSKSLCNRRQYWLVSFNRKAFSAFSTVILTVKWRAVREIECSIILFSVSVIFFFCEPKTITSVTGRRDFSDQHANFMSMALQESGQSFFYFQSLL